MPDRLYGGEVKGAHIHTHTHIHTKTPLAANCVFLSAEGCSEGIEGAAGGGREVREEGGGGKKPSAKPSS